MYIYNILCSIRPKPTRNNFYGTNCTLKTSLNEHISFHGEWMTVLDLGYFYDRAMTTGWNHHFHGYIDNIQMLARSTKDLLLIAS